MPSKSNWGITSIRASSINWYYSRPLSGFFSRGAITAGQVFSDPTQDPLIKEPIAIQKYMETSKQTKADTPVTMFVVGGIASLFLCLKKIRNKAICKAANKEKQLKTPHFTATITYNIIVAVSSVNPLIIGLTDWLTSRAGYRHWASHRLRTL